MRKVGRVTALGGAEHRYACCVVPGEEEAPEVDLVVAPLGKLKADILRPVAES